MSGSRPWLDMVPTAILDAQMAGLWELPGSQYLAGSEL